MTFRRYRSLLGPANVGLALIAALFLANLFVSQRNVRRLVENGHRVARAQEVLTTLEEVLDVATRAETTARGYVITGDATYLDAYSRSVRAAADTLEKLEKLTTDGSRHSRIGDLKALSRARFDSLKSGIALRQKEGFEAAKRQIATNQGRDVMTRLRGLVGEMQSREREELAARARESRRSAAFTTLSGLAGAIMGFSMVGAAYFLFQRDLKHRTRAEEASRRLAALVESSDDAIMGLTVDGVITTWNAGSQRLYGFAAHEMIGQEVFALCAADRRDELRSNLERVREGVRVEHFETVWLSKSGRRIDVSVIISAVKDARDAVVGASAISHDITERKLLRREVLDIAAREQRRIGQDLHDGAGQELTGLSMLSERLANELAARGLPQADAACKIGDGLQKVLDHIRALARGLAPVEVDGAGLMAALTELAMRTCELHDVHCTFRCDEPVRILDDQTAMHLYRMSQEAVTNAVKHGAPRNISIALASDGDLVALTIADDGRGFARLPHRTAGSGLRIMRYRAELIGASLTFAPGKPHGAVLTCTLRQRPTGARTAAAALAEPAPVG